MTMRSLTFFSVPFLAAFSLVMSPAASSLANETVAEDRRDPIRLEDDVLQNLARALRDLNPSPDGPVSASQTTESSSEDQQDPAARDVVDALISALQRLKGEEASEPDDAAAPQVIAEPVEQRPWERGMPADGGGEIGLSAPTGRFPEIIRHLLNINHETEKILSYYRQEFDGIEGDLDIRQNAFPVLEDGYVHFSDLFFNENGQSLSPGSTMRLEETVNWVQLIDQVDKIIIIGYADSQGSKLHNERLSRARAEEAATFLRNAGVDAVEYEVLVHGERQLIEATDEDVAEPLNRRVAIWGRLSESTLDDDGDVM